MMFYTPFSSSWWSIQRLLSDVSLNGLPLLVPWLFVAGLDRIASEIVFIKANSSLENWEGPSGRMSVFMPSEHPHFKSTKGAVLPHLSPASGFQDACGPVTIFKSSLLWVKKLRNHRALGSYNYAKLLFLDHSESLAGQ
jgi:hypothetical protein